jgi:uncharacterized surface protein with fasciclin (FAS1) repeats
MKRGVYAVILTLLLALYATAVVSAQEATTEPIPQPTQTSSEETSTEATAEVVLESTPADDGAHLRVALFAPDAPAVDIYVNGELAVRNLSYPQVSGWFTVAPGTYNIAVTAADADVSNTLIPAVSISASGDTWQTVAATGSVNSGTLTTTLIPEDYSDLMPGTGGFTFFNALEGGPIVNFVRNDVLYFAQISFPGNENIGSSSSLREDAGLFNVRVEAADDPNNVIAEQTDLEIPENAYTLIALVGTPDNPQLATFVTDRAVVAIEKGLLPEPGTLMDALRANENLTAFADAVEQAGLSDLLTSETEYTIFAPANFVLDDMGSMSQDELANLLQGYIIEEKFPSRTVIDTGTFTPLAGTNLVVTTSGNGIFVNDNVEVIDVNIPATNGVIHMLNALVANEPAQ